MASSRTPTGGGDCKAPWPMSVPGKCFPRNRDGNEKTPSEQALGSTMSANPWAVVVFIGLLFIADAIGILALRTGVLFLLFVTFVPLWLVAGALWDRWSFRRSETTDVAQTGEGNDA